MTSTTQRNAVPVHLITGCLGAGKTTLLNHWLSSAELRSQRVALIINEFGDLSVDGQLVPSDTGAVFELNRGSLFCACIRVDFQTTLETIAREVRPDLVIAEATGMAQTSDLLGFFGSSAFSDRFEIASNVCVIDAVNFTKVLPTLKAVAAQAIWADGLVINKTDLVARRTLDQLSALLAEINPRANQIAAHRGQVAWDFVRGLQHVPCQLPPLQAPPTEVVACTISGRHWDEQAFFDAFQRVGGHLLRCKGIVDFGHGPTLVEAVFDRITQTPVSMDQPRYGITAIGWKISAAALQAAFRPALRPSLVTLSSARTSSA